MSNFTNLEYVGIANNIIVYEYLYANENKALFSSHWHKRTEMLYIISGCLEVTIGDEVLTLEEKDFCYIRSSLPHMAISRSKNLKCMMVQFRDNEHQQLLSSRDFLPLADNNIEINKKFKDDDIARLFGLVAEYTYCRNTFQSTMFLGILYEIYGHLMIKHSTAKNPGIYTNDNFTEAVRYINKNYTDILSVSELAEKFAFEPTYFSRIFKKRMGVSAARYITYLKLEYAENLLAETDLSVEIISQKCGFNSAAYFSKCFKERYSLNPLQYQKNCRITDN